MANFRLCAASKAKLAEKGIAALFPIQAQTLAHTLDGFDVVGRARWASALPGTRPAAGGACWSQLTRHPCCTAVRCRSRRLRCPGCRTGCGKTLAFVLPIVERLSAADAAKPSARGRAPRVIVLTPTRELAKQVRLLSASPASLDDVGCLGARAWWSPASDQPPRGCAAQVHADFQWISSGCGLATLCLYGGAQYSPQESALKRGVDIVVGTPGRVKDHLERGTLDLSQIRCGLPKRLETVQPCVQPVCPSAMLCHRPGRLRGPCQHLWGCPQPSAAAVHDPACPARSFRVLDECDEMLNMGFVDDVEQILSTGTSGAAVQTLLFSATLPSWVKSITQRFLQKSHKLVDLVGMQKIKARAPGRATMACMLAVLPNPGGAAPGACTLHAVGPGRLNLVRRLYNACPSSGAGGRSSLPGAARWSWRAGEP